MPQTSTPRPRIRPILLCAALSLAWISPACGPAEDRTPVYPTTGKVFYQGKPAQRAMVTFHPVTAKTPDNANPFIYVDPDGSFQMSTYDSFDGVPVGDYQVTIVWPAESPKQEGNSDDKAAAPTGDRLKGKYADPKTSGLTATIKPEKNELAPFDLK